MCVKTPCSLVVVPCPLQPDIQDLADKHALPRGDWVSWLVSCALFLIMLLLLLQLQLLLLVSATLASMRPLGPARLAREPPKLPGAF